MVREPTLSLQGEFVGSYREVETVEDRQDTGDPHRMSDCSLYKHPGDLHVDIHLFCAYELATIAIIQTTVSPDVNTGHNQVYRGTKLGVTASDPSGKHRLNFHGIVKAWNNFRVPSEQATDSGRVWWTGEGGGVHGSVEAGTSPTSEGEWVGP